MSAATSALEESFQSRALRQGLERCVIQGVQAWNLGVPILAEELANQAEKGERV
jgi:hypothetical protein